MTLKEISAMTGAGLAAGLIGTAAMTASSTIEARLRGRKDSTAPATVGGQVLHVQPTDEEGKKRLSMFMHWEYGINWAFLQPILDLLGIRGVGIGALIQFAAVWGTSLVMLPATGVSKPITEWEPDEIAIDMLHHAIYSLAVSAAYSLFRNGNEEEIEKWKDELDRNWKFEPEVLAEDTF